MQSKRLSKWLLIIFRVIIIIIFLIVAFLILKPLIQDYYPVISQSKGSLRLINSIIFQEQVRLGIPIRLKIPSLNIDTSLESVGLTSKGEVEVPKVYTNAAWYNLSPRPGEIGSSIIDGHSGYKNGVQSVFDNLYKIKKGDKLYVEDKDGVTTTFVVREFRPFGPNDDVSDIFISNDGKAHLNLITCVAAWDVNQKSPNDRFIVFTDKEE
jgi:LPXTG-site transpeptidase (sortase) family protein